MATFNSVAINNVGSKASYKSLARKREYWGRSSETSQYCDFRWNWQGEDLYCFLLILNFGLNSVKRLIHRLFATMFIMMTVMIYEMKG